MDEQKQIEILNNAPKMFCDDIIVAYNPEAVVMVMRSGQQLNAFALSPEQAKRLSQNLQDKVDGYEKQHRPLKAQWSKLPASPIQPADLKSKK